MPVPASKRNAIRDAASSPRWRTRSTGVLGVVVLALGLAAVASVEKPDVSLGRLCIALFITILGAFACAEFGRLSRLRLIGIDTVLCLVIPSWLAGIAWIPRDTVVSLGAATERMDILGWLISVLVLGGCLQINWRTMRGMALKLAIPVIGGTLAASATTWGLAALWGSDFPRTFFLQLAPMMAGGLTAGALPLAAGYADQWGQGHGELLAQMLPALFVANLAAIVGAGIIGMLHPVGAAGNGSAAASDVESFSPADVGLAVVAIIALHVCGAVVSRSSGISSALVVIVVAMAASALDVVPAPVVRGMRAVQVYFTSYLLLPILWLVGMTLMPWEHIVAGFAAPLFGMVIAAVLVLSITGYLVSGWTGLDPADAATITLSRMAMGGTGAVAMLSAGGRLPLLPFALLVTRLGGALTVLIALQAAAVIQP